MKKFLKNLSLTILAFTIIFNFLLTAKTNLQVNILIYKQELSQLYQSMDNELAVERNGLLEKKIDQKLDEIPKQEPKPSYEYIKSMTVRVLHFKDETAKIGGSAGTGTGTIVKITEDYTYILTNKHVAPKGSYLIEVEKDLKRYTAEIIKNGVSRDLSLIRIVGKIKGTVAIKGLKKVKEQDKIYSVGMYLGQYNIYAEGTVAGWINTNSRLMNLPCLFGCSGSGVFDKDGYLVAVVYAGSKYNPFGFDTAKAICVPYIGILTFLEEIL